MQTSVEAKPFKALSSESWRKLAEPFDSGKKKIVKGDNFKLVKKENGLIHFISMIKTPSGNINGIKKKTISCTNKISSRKLTYLRI